MENKITDYLHLYIGCEILMNGGNTYKLAGVEKAKGFWVYYDNSERTHWMPTLDLKLILRPLSDMTEEEVNECWNRLDWSENITTPANRRRLLNDEFLDSDEGREAGWFSFCKILPYLLSKSFDLFGLIESGLAIDKTQTP